ncbi:uncharacterized protein DEA37_0014069, partial [Paragonimus westermani]
NGPVDRIGDHVWFHRPKPPLGAAHKFHCPWLGSFVIVQVRSLTVYVIRDTTNPTADVLTVHYNQLKPAQSPEEDQMRPLPVPPGSVPIAEQTVEISAQGGCSNIGGTEALGPVNVGSVAELYGGGMQCDFLRDRVLPEACVNVDDQSSNSSREASEFGKIINSLSNLSKRDLVRFNGDPMRYWLFIRSSQFSVLNIVQDPEARLSYLIHYCDGEAREAIESCAILEPEEGFRDAMETLMTRFGCPHLIARAHISQLVGGPTVRTNDGDALKKQMQYEADLNASVTVAAIARRLPHALQLEWFKKASGILRTPREPTFKDLFEFLRTQPNYRRLCQGIFLLNFIGYEAEFLRRRLPVQLRLRRSSKSSPLVHSGRV